MPEMNSVNNSARALNKIINSLPSEQRGDRAALTSSEGGSNFALLDSVLNEAQGGRPVQSTPPNPNPKVVPNKQAAPGKIVQKSLSAAQNPKVGHASSPNPKSPRRNPSPLPLPPGGRGLGSPPSKPSPQSGPSVKPHAPGRSNSAKALPVAHTPPVDRPVSPANKSTPHPSQPVQPVKTQMKSAPSGPIPGGRQVLTEWAETTLELLKSKVDTNSAKLQQTQSAAEIVPYVNLVKTFKPVRSFPLLVALVVLSLNLR